MAQMVAAATPIEAPRTVYRVSGDALSNVIDEFPASHDAVTGGYASTCRLIFTHDNESATPPSPAKGLSSAKAWKKVQRGMSAPSFIPPATKVKSGSGALNLIVLGGGRSSLGRFQDFEAREFAVYLDSPSDRRAAVMQVALSRIGRLKRDAQEVGEVINAEAEASVIAFLESIKPTKAPTIFLLENGNFRSVWKQAGGLQIACEHLSGQRIKYVVFGAAKANEPRSRAVGITGFAGLLRVIEAHKLQALLLS